MNTIICKHCGKELEITEALLHQVEEKVKKEVSKDVEEQIRKASHEAAEKAKIEFENQNKEEVEKLKKQNEEFREQELKLREQTRRLEEKEKQMELENARKLDEERKKIEEKVIKEEEEKFLFKLKEQEEEKESLKRKIEELSRKASHSGSQQLQGEVLELALEEQLIRNFPGDDVIGVAKGVRGGDIQHTVKNNYGKVAGKILWETKRANWSASWLPKLRDDSRKAGASISVLVSEELPKEIDTFGVVDGVLVSGYSFALPLSYILRRQLIAIDQAKLTAAHKDEKLEKMYLYLSSDMFRHHIEAFVESAVADQQDLETEKRSMQRVWKKREMQIQRTIENITNMYGELQGIMGSSLPDIKLLTLESGLDEEKPY